MNGRLDEWEAFEKAHPIVVKSELMEPHPIIRQTAERMGFPLAPLVSPQPDDCRWFNIDVSSGHAERALCIADALVKACELRGFELRTGEGAVPDSGVAVVIDGWSVAVELRETGRPPGQLSLEAWGTWNDRVSRPLSKRLNRVILSLRKRVALAQESQRESERYDRHMAELHLCRDELRAEVEAEREAFNELRSHTENWHRAQSMRAYIAAVEAQPVNRRGRAGHARWIVWAREQADRIDPLCDSPPSILDLPRWRFRKLGPCECLNEDGSIEQIC